MSLTEIKCRDFLDEGRSAEICGLFDGDELVENILVADDPANPEAGNEYLRESAKYDDLLGSIEFVKHWRVFPLETELTVRAVFHDENVIFMGNCQNLTSACLRHRNTGRVLEIRNGVNEFWFFPFFLEFV